MINAFPRYAEKITLPFIANLCQFLDLRFIEWILVYKSAKRATQRTNTYQ
jgi:hypothetical protein